MSDVFKLSVKNAMKFLKELTKLKTSPDVDKKEIDFLIKIMAEETDVADRQWLLKEIDELK